MKRSDTPAGLLFLGDGGEMGRRIRAFDWESTPLGSPGNWPQSLKTTVRLLLTSRHPMFIWWGPELIQFYNDAYSLTLGPERHPSALGAGGRECWAEIWPVIGPQIDHVMAGRGSTWHEDQLVPVTRNGRLEQVWWTYGYSPIDIEAGVGGVLVVCNDVTEQHLAREALANANAKLLGDAERLRELFGQAPGFIAILRGPRLEFEFTNAAYEALMGRDDLVGRAVLDVLPEVRDQGFMDLLHGVLATGEAHVGRGVPLRIDRAPGREPEQLYIDFVYQPIAGWDGHPAGIFVQGSDATERVRAEERQALLVGEMNHRVKNTLATVQSLAMLSGRSANSIGEFQSILTNRIASMSKTQDLLVRGLSANVTVKDLIESELAPYMGDGQQAELICEDLEMPPKAAVSLGLLVHELLTNAAKHGALSTLEGRLTVRCLSHPSGAVLIWNETVPALAAKRGGGGFGLLLIERLARALGGGAQIDLREGGLEAVVIFSLSERIYD